MYLVEHLLSPAMAAHRRDSCRLYRDRVTRAVSHLDHDYLHTWFPSALP